MPCSWAIADACGPSPAQSQSRAAAGVTPAKLAALSSALAMPVKQLQRQVHERPQLLQVPAEQLATAHQALRQGLGLPRHAARLMLTHHPAAAARTPPAELRARAARVAALLGRGVTQQHVMAAAAEGNVSLLTRQPDVVAVRLQQLAAALAPSSSSGGGGAAGLSLLEVLGMVGRAPELLTKPPAVVARRLDECLAVLQGRWAPPQRPPTPTAARPNGGGGSATSHVQQSPPQTPGAAGAQLAAAGAQAAAAEAAAGAAAPAIRQRAERRAGSRAAAAAAGAASAPRGPQLSRASVLRALRRQPDLLLLGGRVLRNKLCVLQRILDRPLRLVAPLLLACPALARHDLDAVRAAYEALRPITGRDEGFTFGMVRA